MPKVFYDKQIFAKNLVRLMKEHQEKQTDIAALLKVSKSTVSDYCKGAQMPRMDKIEMLALHYGVLKSELLDDASAPASPESAEPLPRILQIHTSLNESGQAELERYGVYLTEQEIYRRKDSEPHVDYIRHYLVPAAAGYASPIEGEDYENRLKVAQEQVDYYKDLKSRMSTKMVGESLEQHCQIQFNSIRMTAFPNAYFEKDNEVSASGSKGDFIFREKDPEGTEFISIMFEMKNEMDTTATKHKNEDFFKELDKDRQEKGCEYAVLVSLLESDNELYNNGIVDVSYKYPKMYVIRPQFFIPMITLLRNAALNSLQYQKELEVVRNHQLDLVNFESNMQEFKDAFGRNYRLASEKYQTAIDEIDKTIDHLEKVKKALMSSENNLRLANDKAEDLSIKKLTKNAPSVRAMFDEAAKNKEDEA